MVKREHMPTAVLHTEHHNLWTDQSPNDDYLIKWNTLNETVQQCIIMVDSLCQAVALAV